MDRRGENCRFHHFHAHFQHQVREFISHQSRAFHEYFLFKIKFSAPKARSITVEGLRPYTQYQLRLIAENVKGRGAPSEPSQAFEVSPEKKSKIREKSAFRRSKRIPKCFPPKCSPIRFPLRQFPCPGRHCWRINGTVSPRAIWSPTRKKTLTIG